MGILSDMKETAAKRHDQVVSLIAEDKERSASWVLCGSNAANIFRNSKGFQPAPVVAPIASKQSPFPPFEMLEIWVK
jgi:hypothetical protein